MTSTSSLAPAPTHRDTLTYKVLRAISPVEITKSYAQGPDGTKVGKVNFEGSASRVGGQALEDLALGTCAVSIGAAQLVSGLFGFNIATGQRASDPIEYTKGVGVGVGAGAFGVLLIARGAYGALLATGYKAVAVAA